MSQAPPEDAVFRPPGSATPQERSVGTSIRTEFELTEVGMAERVCDAHGQDFRFVAQMHEFIVWNGRCWERDTTGAVDRFVVQVIRETKRHAADLPPVDSKKLFDHAHACESNNKIRAISQRIASQAGVGIGRARLDANPWILPVNNGTIDLRSGTLQDHRREDMATIIAPVDFDADAKSDLWDGFINRITDGNPDLSGYLRRIGGQALTGDASEQELYICHGIGGNGKSVFLDTLAGMLGPYACEAAETLLTSRGVNTHPTEVADIAGRRLVVASETEEGAKLRAQMVKRLTGNKMQKGRFMGKDFFEFPRTHKLILVTNHKPVIRETTHAIWRRIRLVPFDAMIPPEECDARLTEKLCDEWPAILNWCITGCRDWQANGMKPPQTVTGATDMYQAEQAPLADFLEDCAVVDADGVTEKTTLFKKYQDWAHAAGKRDPLDRSAFYEAMLAIPGVAKSSSRIDGVPRHVFRGVKLQGVAEEYRQATMKLQV